MVFDVSARSSMRIAVRFATSPTSIIVAFWRSLESFKVSTPIVVFDAVGKPSLENVKGISKACMKRCLKEILT